MEKIINFRCLISKCSAFNHRCV